MKLASESLSDDSDSIISITQGTAHILPEDKVNPKLDQELQSLSAGNELIKILVKFYSDIDSDHIKKYTYWNRCQCRSRVIYRCW